MANVQITDSASLTPTALTSGVVQVPLTLHGIDNHLNPGDQVTETPTPVQNSVSMTEGQATVSGQSMLFDTGAQVTLISTATARALGLDLAHPSFSTSVQGVGGSIQVPGYTLDELDLPTKDGSLLRFTHPSVYVLNVDGFDGVLGMNLFNTASRMLYDATKGSPSVSFTFFTAPETVPSDGSSEASLAALRQLDPVFAATIHGTAVPELGLFSGRISGHVFLDFNQDGQMSSKEPGLSGQTVFLDSNGNGVLDSGEVSTTTDANGFFQFKNLPPGSYAAREVIPSGLTVSVPTSHAVATLPAANGTTTTYDFGVLPLYQDATTAYIADLYGMVLDRAPDIGGYNGWLQYLQQGGTRQQMAAAIWESPEHRGIQVDSFFQTLLHRKPKAAGRTFWVNMMVNGASEVDVQRMIIASTEYQALHPDDLSYLTALFNDLLNRAPGKGISGWQAALASGLSRDTVALSFLTSTERWTKQIDSYYQTFLQRPAQTTDESTWLPLAGRYDKLPETLLGSDEFFTLARRFASA
jgi:hypothetical protein